MHLFGQKERVNCIIFIDGKLSPNISVNIEYMDSLEHKQIIESFYWMGEIVFSPANAKTLDVLSDTTTLKINFRYREFKKNHTSCDYYYSGEYKKGWFVKNAYIIFMINNLNKKKGTYNIAFRSSISTSFNWHKKDYELFHMGLIGWW